VRDPLRSLLLTLLIDQEAVIDVVQWDVVLRVVGNLPAVLRRRRIEDLVVVQIAAHPSRHRFYAVRHGGHLGVIPHGSLLPAFTQSLVCFTLRA